MSYKEIKGNLFNSNAKALGNTVNCYGVMGKGIALEFRRRFPDMFRMYQKDCVDGKLVPGHIYYYSCSQTTILNITTKNHWRYPSKIEWVRSALEQFTQEYKAKNITNVALPSLGTQSGGLDGREVRSLMQRYLQNLPDVEIDVYTHDPSEGDPLFQILKGICLSKDPLRYFIESGFPPKLTHHIIEDITADKIRSLAELNQSKLLSEKRLDKLYIILMQLLQDEKANKATQPLIFLENALERCIENRKEDPLPFSKQ
jgi:O-acetyl-ADP-ribose deacetylase (regulator of RNase III)